MRDLILIFICAITLGTRGEVEINTNGCPTDFNIELLLSHDTYCNKFYHCKLGNRVERICPSGLVFNEEEQICDWPKNVDCENREINEEINNGEGDNETENDNEENNSNGDGVTEAGDNNAGGNSDPSEAPALCAAEDSDGVLVAHEECNKFYKCAHGLPIALKCPSDLLWNPSTEQCDWSKNVECGDRVIPENEAENHNDSDEAGEGDNGGNEDGDNNGEDNETEDPREEDGEDSGDNNNNGAGNSDPNEAPALCAAEDSDGILVAHEECNKFYKCAHGLPIALKCPSDLLWNPSIEQCDWSKNVECGDRVIPENEAENNNDSDEAGEGDNGGNEDGDNNGEDNVTEDPREEDEEDSGDNNNNGGGNSDPNEAPALCAAEDSDGVLVAHEECNKFYKCAHGLPIALKCPSDLLWNPSIEQCDWYKNVECGDRVIPENEAENNNDSDEAGEGDNGGNEDGDNNGEDNVTEDPREEDEEDSGDNNNNGGGNSDPNEAPALCAAEDSDGVLVAHEECNKFYKCAHGLPIALKCPSDLLWNPSIEQCDWSKNVECGDRVIPENEAENNNDSDEAGKGDNGGNEDGDNNGEDNVTEDPREEDEEDSGDNNNNGGGNSDPNEAPALCAAEDSDGVLVAHEECNKFYKCAHGLPIALKCPSDLLWNPSIEQCDWSKNVECGDRVIPENEAENNNDSDEAGEGDNGGNEDGDNNGEDNVTEDPREEDEEDSGNNNNNGGGNSDPNEAPALCAAEDSDGVLVAHEECNKFYKCAHGLPIALKCPSDLLWNPSIEQCDWSKNVECGDRVIPENEAENNNDSDEAGEGDNGGNEDGDNNGEDNVTENPREEDEEDSGDNNNNGGGNSDPNEAPALCAADNSDGVLVAHEECNKFYKCAHGLPIALKCPLDLLWNPSIEQCDWSKNVECGDRVIPENEAENHNDSDEAGEGDNGGNEDGDNNGEENVTENPREEDEEDSGDNNNNGGGNSDPNEAPALCAAEDSDGVLVAHEECNKFYKCAHGLPIALKCPLDLLWNPSIEQCDWSKNVECGDRVIPENEAENNNDSDEAGEGDNGGNEDGDNNGEDNETEDPREEDGEDSGDNNNNGGGNSDPNEAPALCAADNSDGVLVAHEECNKFYKCAHGLPIALKCPLDLLWNPSIEQCDWSKNVECGDRVIPENEAENHNDSDEAGEGDNGGNEDGDNNGEENETEDPREEDGEDSGDNNNNGAGNSDPSEAPALCAAEDSDGILVAHEECNKFYKCVHGLPIALKCPSDLLWNPSIEQCDWSKNVECGDRVIPENEAENNNDSDEAGEGDNGGNEDGDNNGEDNETEDPREEDEEGSGDNNNNGGGNSDPSEAPALCAAEDSDGILVAHEECNKFYKCAHGLPIALKCPSDLLWNPSAEQCDWSKNVECGDRVIPENEAENNNDGDETGEVDNEGNEDGDNNGEDNVTEDPREEDEEDSGNNNNNGGGNSDPNEAPALCAAEDSDGVLVAHEKCNKFYKCSNGLPVALKCPSDLLWNPSAEQCDWSENVECGDRVIPDNEAGNNNDGDEAGEGDNEGNEDGDNNGENNETEDPREKDEEDSGYNNSNGGGNSDPSEAPAICAAEDSDGVLVAHEVCNKFYKCSNGLPVALKCPSDLLWKPSTEKCDWPENVDCKERLVPDNEADDDENESEAIIYSKTVNRNKISTNSRKGVSDPSLAPAICSVPGTRDLFIAHEYCNQYYICHDGKPWTFVCSGNLLYNPDISQCDSPQNVDCGRRLL